MFFIVFFLLANFAGLAALFTTIALWRRESGNATAWLVSRRGLGALCVLAAGAGLLAGAHYKAAVFNFVSWPSHRRKTRLQRP